MMKIWTYWLQLNMTIFVLFCHTANASQSTTISPITDDDVLFTYGEDTVTKSEFLYVYEKHNANDSIQFSKQSVDEYLELYINFKLKVKEAENMGIHTKADIIKQLAKHRKELAKSYLYDKKVSEELIKEAYNRMKKEVKTSHILIMVNPNASPKDTTIAYEKIMKLYDRINNSGESFTDIARKYSEDPSVTDNNGTLGYITAFQTVYPFESAAYNTPVGTVSKPVRTKFGYHLIKVEDSRPARGKIKVAHILVKSSAKDTPEEQKVAKKKIKALAKSLKKGVTFGKAAEASSEDKVTARQGGELEGWWTSGRLLPEFEEAAFGLNNIDDISKPFQTKIGWHIVQLKDKKVIGSYDETKNEIQKRIERDSRSDVSKDFFVRRLKKDYQFKENEENLTAFTKKTTDKLLKGTWKPTDAKDLSKVLFEITVNGKTKPYTEKEFAIFVESNQSKARSKSVTVLINQLYDLYVEKTLIAVEESMLDTKYPDFGKLMKEFRDGNLLYELMGIKVWNKAMQDSAGLQNFYKKHQDNYKWKERVQATIIKGKDEAEMEIVKRMINKQVSNKEKVKTKVKQGALVTIEIEEGAYEKGQSNIIDQVKWEKGTVDYTTDASGMNYLVLVNDILPSSTKKLKEAKGYVVADYQTELEKQWVNELRTKYPVVVKDSILKTIYKK